MQQKLLLDCEAALGSEAAQQQAAELEAVLLQQLRPVNVSPTDGSNAAFALEASFENACILLEGKGVSRPAELSLYSFYSRVRHHAQSKNTK